MVSDSAQYDRRDVLVVPHQSVEGVFQRPDFICDPKSMNSVLRVIENLGRFVDRAWAEEHTCVKQIVAYGVVRNDQRVLCLRRSSKTSRDSLKLRYTLLVGGHVDDLEKNSINPLENCLQRELDEELGIAPCRAPVLLGFAIDPTTAVGQLHLGVVFDVTIGSTVVDVPPKLDNAEFVNASGRHRYELKPIGSVLKLPFDPWSSLFLASSACARLFGRSYPDTPQMRLPLCWHTS